MLASSKALSSADPAARPEGESTHAAAPALPRESLLRAASRWMLGLAYAMHPQRILDVPYLLLWMALDAYQGGTRVPDQNRTKSRPDTFGGLVRDLSVETYMAGLRLGFFPWAHCGPLKWWTRQKRLVLFFPELHIPRRLRRTLRSGKYRVTFDTAFAEVLESCAAPRSYNWHTLTWLTPRQMALFKALHAGGHAHSFEVWNREGELVAGGFGVASGRMFVGESMFSRESDTSKLGATVLYAHLAKWGYAFVDARDFTPVLAATGYREIPRVEFEGLLAEHASAGGRSGRWTAEDDPAALVERLLSPGV
jgi:leucyl/phenylalanyl-tRNA--protein transferase